MKNSSTFAIVGGGIGGLTLAIALQRKGWDVTVYEHAPHIKPLGAGLVLAANAVMALDEMGLKELVQEQGKLIEHIYIKDQKGRILSATNAQKVSEQYGLANGFSIHRADLHQVLTSQLQPGTLKLGKACVDFMQSTTGTTLYFLDGTKAQADYVIASDGIHSAIRKKVLPHTQSRFAGYTCWRATIDAPSENFLTNNAVESWGNGARFGMVPLSKNRIYWYACVNAAANDPIMRCSTIEEVQHFFKSFHDPIPRLLELTRNEQLIWSDIIDLKPIEQFAFGKVVLIGDAAHATTPNMGQGACMAIEDAAVLTNCLDQCESVEEAFQKFEKKRIARTTKIVNTSWTLGKISQWQHPVAAALRNTALRMTPANVSEKQMKYLFNISFQ